MKFPKLVIEEAKALKKHATKEEINSLDFEKLLPTHKNACIYGQMTGSCFSERAIELIQISARRVYNDDGTNLSHITRKQLNGSPKEKSRWRYWSPIEVFIAKKIKGQKEANQKLIQFIKGEIKSL